MNDTMRRTLLGELLRNARRRVSPAHAGLQPSGKRRTVGLRREDVAELADISTKWFAQLETGVSTVSMRTLERISDALQLTVAERVELFRLARPEIDRITESPSEKHHSERVLFEEMPRRRRRPRHADVGMAIREAALELTSTLAYAGVSLEDIAEAADVELSELRQSYPTVADLYLHVVTAIGSEIRPAVTEPTQSGRILRHALDVGRAFRSETGVILRGLLGDAQRDPNFNDRFRDFIEQRRMALVFLIKLAIKNGELSPEFDPHVIADRIFGPLWYRLIMDLAPLTEAYITEIVDHALASCAASTRRELSRKMQA